MRPADWVYILPGDVTLPGWIPMAFEACSTPTGVRLARPLRGLRWPFWMFDFSPSGLVYDPAGTLHARGTFYVALVRRFVESRGNLFGDKFHAKSKGAASWA